MSKKNVNQTHNDTDMEWVKNTIDSVFDGPQKFDELALEFAHFIMKIRELGKKDAFNQIQEEAKEKVKTYIKTIVSLAKSINDKSLKCLQEDFNIIEVRAKLCPRTQWIDLNFIIDSSFDNELKFTKVLTEIKQEFLRQNNLMAEILFINQKDSGIDYSSLKNDYPFIIKLYA
ncbi:MAG: hypothetical protein AB1454_05160 [Candidatus Auribacterota bacterium]